MMTFNRHVGHDDPSVTRPHAEGDELENAYFGENKLLDDHSSRSLRGGVTSVFARAINAFAQIGTVLFLARLLTPEDYGLVAMVTAFTGFAPLLVDLGTRDAIVQRTQISRGEVSALFWLTVTVGVTLTALTALGGPLIARFYGEPRLTMIVLVSSVTFVVYALQAHHGALLRRAMRFEQLAIIDVTANVASAVIAVASAFYGAGYFALLVRAIATPTFTAAGVWFKSRWIPSKPTVTPGVRESVRFGLNLTGFGATDVAGRSVDRIAIGHSIGASGLGQYQNAMFVYDNLLDILVYPLHGVAIAGLSKLRGDLPQLRVAWAKALSMVAFYAMPAFGMLAVSSEDMIVLLLGARWESAGVLLGVLAFRGIPQCVERTFGWLHVTAGRTDRWMRWGVFAMLVHVGALFLGLPYGPMGVAVAYVVVMFFLFVPAVAYAGWPLEIGASDVVRTIWRQLAAALASAGFAELARWTLLADVHAFARMVILCVLYLVTYLLIVVVVLRLRAPIRTMQSLVWGYLPPRLAERLT
jgi:PST family polysaccharide transporter